MMQQSLILKTCQSQTQMMMKSPLLFSVECFHCLLYVVVEGVLIACCTLLLRMFSLLVVRCC